MSLLPQRFPLRACDLMHADIHIPFPGLPAQGHAVAPGDFYGGLVGGDDEGDHEIDPEGLECVIAAGQRRLARVAPAPMGPEKVIADLDEILAIDFLFQAAAVAEIGVIIAADTPPEPVAVIPITIVGALEIFLGLRAIPAGRKMLHRDRIAIDAEEVLHIIHREGTEIEPRRLKNNHGHMVGPLERVDRRRQQTDIDAISRLSLRARPPRPEEAEEVDDVDLAVGV